jgi:hypothetical protein
MALVDNNIVTKGLRGKVGNLVFRRRGNKTTVYVLSPRKAPLSEKQQKAKQQFSIAVNMASIALRDKKERKRFEELARQIGKESAYGAAVSYFMKKEL